MLHPIRERRQGVSQPGSRPQRRLCAGEDSGQALVEFALIILVLTMLIFVLIEGAHLFQAQLTVQNAARAAGRYAVTGQFDTDCLADIPPCEDVRLTSIRAVAEEALTGLRLDPNAGFFDPRYFEVQIFGADANGNLVENNPGLAGQPVIIRVVYRAEVITPLLRPIAETVLLQGQTVMNNEAPAQTSSSGLAPVIPGLPPVGPTATPPPPQPPDLTVEKDAPERVLVNTGFRYRLEVANLGEETATQVRVSDVLPSQVIYASGCSYEGTTVECHIGDLRGGEQMTFFINVVAGPDVATDVANTATVSAGNEDATKLDNNSSTARTDIVDGTSTDLAVTKNGPLEVWAESIFAYSLRVQNLGLQPAEGIEVTDTLPAGMSYQAEGSDGRCRAAAPGEVVCTEVALAPGASTTFEIHVQAPAAVGAYVNRAEVRMAFPADSDTNNDWAEHTVEVQRMADLWITKSGAPSTLHAGEQLVYTLQVGNSGPSAATAVVVDDVLPSSVAFVAATLAGGEPCARSGSVVTCQVGELAVGETATATIVVTPRRSGIVVNSAQVSGSESDPNTSNNTAAVSHPITLLADLSIVKSAPASARSGEAFDYVIVVTNNGPSAATGVTVRDLLAGNNLEHLVFRGAVATQGYCEFDETTRLVSCALGRLAAGNSATIRLRVIPALPTGGGSAQTYTNVAEVTWNEPNYGPQSSEHSSTVVTGPASIHLDPTCGPAGAEVVIQGYNWSNDSRDIRLTWNNAAGAELGLIASDVRSNSETHSFTHSGWSIPTGTAAGDYKVIATQGTTSVAAPFKVPCAGPDLAAGSISHAATAAQGDLVSFSVVVSNVGTEPVVSPFYVSLYFAPVPEPDLTTTTHISSVYRQNVAALSGLPPGASQTVTFNVESQNLPAGSLPVYVVVDSDPGPTGSITEMNELNNLAASSLTVLPGAGFGEPPTGSLVLTGQTRLLLGPELVVQPYVPVHVFSGGILLASAFSDASGVYRFDSLPAGTGIHYDIKSCYVLDGVSYFSILLHRQATANPWTLDLQLEEGVCS